MKFIRQIPSPQLADCVKYFWYMEVGQEELPCSQVSFPYGAFELIYYVQNPNKMQWLDGSEEFYEPQLFYAGQLTRPYLLKFEQPCICAGVSMWPWAGNLLFDMPANHFKNNLVDLSDLCDDRKLRNELFLCHTPDEIFNCFEKYVLAQKGDTKADTVAMMLAKSAISNPLYENMEKTLQTIGLSRRRIEQRFVESAGLTMSMFLKKTRFQRSVQLIADLKENENFGDVSFSLGYYDQAHFVHDFKRFSGITPSQFMRTKSSGLNQFFRSVSEPVL